MKILSAVGARPNLIKIAPLIKELVRRGHEAPLVHTGQHYDSQMSRIFFEELEIPFPAFELGVGSASHAVMTAEIMIHFDEVLHAIDPDCVVVVGDVNSTLACALTATKLLYPVAHVESGLRCYDRNVPEEINRIVTDHISDLLFAQSDEDVSNLLREGIGKSRIHSVGNIMIDTLFQYRNRAMERSDILARHDLKPGEYALVTLHHPDNVDYPARLGGILHALTDIATHIPVIFPLHPRTRKMAKDFGLFEDFTKRSGLIVTEPLGYLNFLALLTQCRFAMTDSGGVMEETSALGIPCLTIRDHTSRAVTEKVGTNRVVGIQAENIQAAAMDILEGRGQASRVLMDWDGQAAGRIVDVLESRFSKAQP